MLSSLSDRYLRCAGDASTDGGIHIHRRRQREAEPRTLRSHGSICSGIWTFQRGLGGWIIRRAYLGRLRAGKSRLVYYDLDLGCVECCDYGAGFGLHGGTHISEEPIRIKSGDANLTNQMR